MFVASLVLCHVPPMVLEVAASAGVGWQTAFTYQNSSKNEHCRISKLDVSWQSLNKTCFAESEKTEGDSKLTKERSKQQTRVLAFLQIQQVKHLQVQLWPGKSLREVDPSSTALCSQEEMMTFSFLRVLYTWSLITNWRDAVRLQDIISVEFITKGFFLNSFDPATSLMSAQYRVMAEEGIWLFHFHSS